MPTRAKSRRTQPSDTWSLPPLHTSTTSQGMRVLVLPRGPLPLVSVRLVIEAGSAHDPSGKEGLADFTARLLRRGAGGRSAQEIDDAVEFVGASLSVGASEELLILHLTTPERHLSAMLEVLATLVSQPDFPDAEVVSARTRTLAQLANELDEPGAIADRALTRAWWGTHPYGHDTSGSARQVAGFTREDVVGFHREKVGPRVSLISVVGAVEPKAAVRAIEKAFKGFTGGPDQAPRTPALAKRPVGHVVLVDKPDQTQAQVRMVGPGFKFGAAPHFPAVVMNIALGGGFTSRLINEIRVNRGLTYGISSGFAPMRADGSFLVSTFTKTETTQEIIQVTLDELKKLREEGMTREELRHAQTYLAGLYPLRNETNDALASSLAELAMNGQGPDWIEHYRERVRAVTLVQANEVAQTFLYPEPPVLVVVGRARELKKPLATFGKVKVIPASEVE